MDSTSSNIPLLQRVSYPVSFFLWALGIESHDRHIASEKVATAQVRGSCGIVTVGSDVTVRRLATLPTAGRFREPDLPGIDCL